MAAAAGGGALRAESRITPPKIQGGAAEVKTPASFPILSHNFGKPRPRGASAPRGRDWNGRGKPRRLRPGVAASPLAGKSFHGAGSFAPSADSAWGSAFSAWGSDAAGAFVAGCGFAAWKSA